MDLTSANGFSLLSTLINEIKVCAPKDMREKFPFPTSLPPQKHPSRLVRFHSRMVNSGRRPFVRTTLRRQHVVLLLAAT